jgi:hypothetical protein
MERLIACLACLSLTAPASAQWAWVSQGVDAADTSSRDHYGASVSVDGDTALIGAPLEGDPDLGAVYVFVRSGTTWVEAAKLTASDGAPDDDFGRSVAVRGDTALIGAPGVDDLGADKGATYVFVRSGSTWSEQAKLLASDGGGWFGASVALSGETALVGAPTHNGIRGAAYAFVRSGTRWSEEDMLLPGVQSPGDRFGTSVALSGEVALVGAPFEDGPFGGTSGVAYVFRRSGKTWAQEDKLNGRSSSDRLGMSVSIEGDLALAGAPEFDSTFNSNGGKAHVYRFDGTAWNLEADLIPTGIGVANLFGWSVSLAGDKAVIGAPKSDPGGADSGSVFVFRGSGTTWTEESQLEDPDGAPGDQFGIAVSASANTVLAGAQYNDHAGLSSGSARAFEGLSPSYVGSYCTAGTSASGCQALIATSGTPSATAEWGFSLLVQNMEGAKNGLFFYGTNGKQANPWGNGSSFVCVIPPRLRGDLLVAEGSTAGACDGFLTQDLNARWCPTCPKPAHNPGAGAVVQAQLWYRDPNNTANVDTSMSDAIEFTVLP